MSIFLSMRFFLIIGIMVTLCSCIIAVQNMPIDLGDVQFSYGYNIKKTFQTSLNCTSVLPYVRKHFNNLNFKNDIIVDLHVAWCFDVEYIIIGANVWTY